MFNGNYAVFPNGSTTQLRSEGRQFGNKFSILNVTYQMQECTLLCCRSNWRNKHLAKVAAVLTPILATDDP